MATKRAVRLDVGRFGVDASITDIVGKVRFRATKRLSVVGDVVLPADIPGVLGATVDLPVTASDYGFVVDVIGTVDGQPIAASWCVTVPDGAGEVPLSGLPEVDRRSFSQVAPPAWTAQLQSVIADVAAKQPLDGDLTAIAALTPADGDVVQRVSGSWSSRTITQLKTALGLVKGDVGLGSVDNMSDFPTPGVGTWYFSASSGSASATLGNNNLRVQPFIIKKTTRIDRLSIPVTVVGQAGSTVRLGIYADTGTGYPGNLMVDSGPLAGDVVANPQAPVDVTLTPGVYWIGGVVQGGASTQPTIISATATLPFPIAASLTPATPPAQTGTVCGYTMSATGALPSTFSTTISTVGAAPRVSFRVAA